MNYHNSSENTYHEVWAQQGHGQSSDGYTQGTSGYSNRTRQTHPQPGTEPSYYHHQYDDIGALHYSYSERSAPRASRMQSAASSSGAYPVQPATNGFAGGYSSNSYANTMPQYSQQYVLMGREPARS